MNTEPKDEAKPEHEGTKAPPIAGEYCSTCRLWDTANMQPGYGLCRYQPVTVAPPGMGKAFAITASSDWCVHWE
jgi:hypothetical protein